MSVDNTSLLDITTYEAHQKLLLDFMHDMYLMTGTKQTAHLSIVQSKIQKTWDEQDERRSRLLWDAINDKFYELTGSGLKNTESAVRLVESALRIRALLVEVAEKVGDPIDFAKLNYEWEEHDDDY